ncbi:hypothetical protein BDB00DRAFT_845898 [Zychaea mexicana]|uniref:uncharacterized protein n=1 Tax=Zychaea mexicana TaxID=64656 RepID=UPI0022FDBAE4|nr:uncharacterized protein BDB00DRAFT_845898 [Zychaea mexicana]KAI9488952.1 hypothetical protein BDB00DRAFT_845898 [Zychaea mexicana]
MSGFAIKKATPSLYCVAVTWCYLCNDVTWYSTGRWLMMMCMLVVIFHCSRLLHYVQIKMLLL